MHWITTDIFLGLYHFAYKMQQETLRWISLSLEAAKFDVKK